MLMATRSTIVMLMRKENMNSFRIKMAVMSMATPTRHSMSIPMMSSRVAPKGLKIPQVTKVNSLAFLNRVY